MKALLILVDGMRPDALADLPAAHRLMAESAYTMNATTVFPSVTLPCHMSLFHSVDPDRHGTTTNTYAPQVRPICGLFDQLHRYGKQNAFFYNWHELRDLCRPDALAHEFYFSGHQHGYTLANPRVTDAAIDYIAEFAPDFTFLYLGEVDEAGHKYGWMSPEYREAVRSSFEQIDRIRATLSGEYTLIVTADHGGHGRGHGSALPEDMTIPLFVKSTALPPCEIRGDVNIKDIAPTIAALLGVPANEDWEGKSLLP